MFGKLKDAWALLSVYRHREEILTKLFSRKLWAAVAGAALVAFGQQLGIPESLYGDIVTIVVTFIAGQSAVDAAAALNKKP